MRGGWKQKLYLTVFNLLDLKQKSEKNSSFTGEKFLPILINPIIF